MTTPTRWDSQRNELRGAGHRPKRGTATVLAGMTAASMVVLTSPAAQAAAGIAGEPGMQHPFALSVEPTDGAANIYLEVAAGVTMFILAGRYFEKRSKRQAGAALRALLELGAKDVAVLRGGVETRIPTSDLVVGDEFVVRPSDQSCDARPPPGRAPQGGVVASRPDTVRRR